MEQPPPLTPQQLSELSANEYAELGQPQSIKIFGVLHLVFGAFGILASIWSVYIVVAGNPFINMGGPSPVGDLQAKLEAELKAYTILSTALYVLITALIMIAGIKLVKVRRDALKWSNAYAYTSILSKIVNIVASVVYVAPKTAEVITAMGGSGTAGAMTGMMSTVMSSTMIVTGIVTMVYPILTLILLNRAKVKSCLANQPA